MTPELHKLSWHCLITPKTAKKHFEYFRDRAMVLLSTATAFRGDSARILLWSDLYMTETPMDEIGLGRTITTLVALADNAKTNQEGRVDEHGVLRHRLVELCPVNAVALLLFAYFHIRDFPKPEFAPNFNDKTYGEYGCRSWYKNHVFWGKAIQDEMLYESKMNNQSVFVL